MKRKIKLVLTDSQDLFSEGLKRLFRKSPQFEVVAWAQNLSDLLNILQDTDPDIVILDPLFRVAESKQALSTISHRHPGVKVVIIGVKTDDDTIHEFVILGAKAYISRFLQPEELLGKLKLVNSNGHALDGVVLQRLLNDKSSSKQSILIKKDWLTDKEKEIFVHLKSGSNETQIADLLNLSKSTIHTHKKNMFRKTNTHSVAQLISFIERNCWI